MNSIVFHNEEKVNPKTERAAVTSEEALETKSKMKAEAVTSDKLSTSRALSEFFLERKDLEGLDFEVVKNGKYYMKGDLAAAAMKKHGDVMLRVKREKRAQRLSKKLSKLETKPHAKEARPSRGPKHARVDLVNDSPRKQWQHMPSVNHSFFRPNAPLFTAHRVSFPPFYSSCSGNISHHTMMHHFPLHRHPYHFLHPWEQQVRMIQHANKSMLYSMMNTKQSSSSGKQAIQTPSNNTSTSVWYKQDLINPMLMEESNVHKKDCLSVTTNRNDDCSTNVQLTPVSDSATSATLKERCEKEE
jgi:hypothetical protein